jgi:phosphatidylinositol glycan class B
MLYVSPKRDMQSSKRLFLFGFLSVALLLRIVVSMRSSSMVQPDEVFQTLEPAHRLAYGYGVVTWEWRDGVRSWVFPAFLACIMRATGWAGVGSSGYLAGTTLVLSLISLSSVWFGFAWANRARGLNAAILVGGMCTVWYELVIFAPRAFNEVLAAHILLPGLYLGTDAEGPQEKTRLFLASLFCGVAMSLRIQLAPAVAFMALYFCRSNWKRKISIVIAGLICPVILFGAVDAATWQYPFQSFIRYFWVNLVEGKSTVYGSAPWYWYLTILSAHMSLLLLFVLAGIRSSPLLGTIALIVLISHSALAHKEIRFIYPIVPLLVVLAGLGAIEIANEFDMFAQSLFWSRMIIVAALILFALASGLLASRFEYGYNSGSVEAFDQLSSDPTVCGVGLYGVPWFRSGGYVHLHHNVPIVLISEDRELNIEASTFNVVIVDATLPAPGIPFDLRTCWNGACVYHRTGSCISPIRGEINTELLRTGQ